MRMSRRPVSLVHLLPFSEPAFRCSLYAVRPTPTAQVQRTETPVAQPTPAPLAEKVDPSIEWVIKINTALDRHD
jgi:hypothetical protein